MPFYRHPLFITWFLVLTLVAVLNFIALELFLYWVYPWFDSMMHFLGGMFVGLVAYWFFFEPGYVRVRYSLPHVLGITFVSIAVIGIGWEVFELVGGIPREDNFAFDTTVDLIMDTVGAYVAVGYAMKKYTSNRHHHGQ